MTPPHLHRSSGLLARSALVLLVLAGGAEAAASQAPGGATAAPRTAVLAGADAPAAAVTNASARASGAIVRRADGTFDAQAQATRLAAEGFDTIVGVGAEARAAVAQAAAGEVGDGTRWEAAAR